MDMVTFLRNGALQNLSLKKKDALFVELRKLT
jgi:hypothetical protein